MNKYSNDPRELLRQMQEDRESSTGIAMRLKAQEAQIQQMQNLITQLHNQLRIESQATVKEQQFAAKSFREIQQRKHFDDWLRETYPDIIAQYKAVMDLVEFMEDPPPPTITRNTRINTSRHQFGWDQDIEARRLKALEDHMRTMQREVEMEIWEATYGKWEKK